MNSFIVFLIISKRYRIVYGDYCLMSMDFFLTVSQLIASNDNLLFVLSFSSSLLSTRS